MILNKISLPLVLVLCLLVQISIQAKDKPIPFPQAVINEMSSRTARYHHVLWHNVRDNWNFFSQEARDKLTSLGWDAPRPSRGLDENGNLMVVSDNNSGEDFLYMHRQMIKKVNQIICDNNDPYGPVLGWKTLPAPGDADWPVPDAYTLPGDAGFSTVVTSFKSNAFYNENMKPMEDLFTDLDQLNDMTLGEFGSLLEITVHNWLHLRFSAESKRGYRPSSSTAIPKIAKIWDHPKYNWLADTYSSHVNPIFWKLHGWVDDRIEDWKVANGVTEIQWIGTWAGGPMSAIAAAKKKAGKKANNNVGTADMMDGMPDDDVDDGYLDEVLSVLAKEKVKETSFEDVVKSNFKPKKGKKKFRGIF